ncbi:MAG: hypothetical protein QNJ51_24360 [Calothrix sp. MO_167.B12]|nr:hypothetical protein [Calothrix sp. MO_167.B12]
MIPWHRCKSGTAALMAMAISTGAIVPILLPSPATAQMFPSQFRRIAISRGAVIPTKYPKDKIIVTPKETKSIELEIPNNIIDNNGQVLIPANSKMKGKLEPATLNGEEGSQFVASELIFPDGRRQSIDAVSNIITRKETIRKGAGTRKILEGAAVGTVASVLISLLTGDNKVNFWEIITGGGLGAAASAVLRRQRVTVLMIEPNKGDLDVSLRSDFVIPNR